MKPEKTWEEKLRELSEKEEMTVVQFAEVRAFISEVLGSETKTATKEQLVVLANNLVSDLKSISEKKSTETTILGQTEAAVDLFVRRVLETETVKEPKKCPNKGKENCICSQCYHPSNPSSSETVKESKKCECRWFLEYQCDNCESPKVPTTPKSSETVEEEKFMCSRGPGFCHDQKCKPIPPSSSEKEECCEECSIRRGNFPGVGLYTSLCKNKECECHKEEVKELRSSEKLDEYYKEEFKGLTGRIPETGDIYYAWAGFKAIGRVLDELHGKKKI